VTAPPSGWDDIAVRSPAGHVLQSVAWAEIRESQGWRPEFLAFDGEPRALLLWRSLPGGRAIAYAPRGPIAAPGDAAGLRTALAGLAAHARECGAVFVKVDPELSPEVASDALRASGFRRAPDVQPVVSTLELDLAPDEDTLMKGLDKDTRWSVRQVEKRDVKLRDADGEKDLRAFYDLYAETGGRARFVTRTWDYYRGMWGTLIRAGHARVRLAERAGRAVAAAMTWRCGERELYQTAATNDEGRKAYAAYGLLWRCIIEAKASGAKRFDFGGIPADLRRKDDPMQGPYLFKKGFGGTERRFVGAHDAVPNELAYRAYRIAEPVYTAALRLRGRLA
jgi:lipid II:glycine glycyltransferase (peptidoglycan interpeptide bridge formation enzyme)